MSTNTVQAYLHDVAMFREFLEEGRAEGSLAADSESEASAGGAKKAVQPLEITPDHIEAWMANIFDRRAKATSQARMLSGVRSFFHFLVVSQLLQASPVEFVDNPKAGRPLPDVLSLAEIDAMLATIDLSAEQGHRNRAMLETLYSCGLRVSELAGLRLGDLFFDDGFIRVTGKGNKQRLVPLSGEAERQIGLWLEQRRTWPVDSRSADVVFLNRRGKHLSRVMIFNIIRECAAAAGIAKQVSPHTLRHSFATHLLQGGASIRQVQELLGHESILTTEIYTHLDRTHLKESVEKHHPLSTIHNP